VTRHNNLASRKQFELFVRWRGCYPDAAHSDGAATPLSRRPEGGPSPL